MVELRRLDVVDWEPTILQFHFSSKDPDHGKRLQDYFIRWFQEKPAQRTCPCSLAFLKVWTIDPKTVVALSEWFCERCIGAFIDGLRNFSPDLELVELGISAETAQECAANGLVDVPAQEVEFEDGRRVFVDEFQVSRYPIIVSAYEAFVRATGYRTTADRNGESVLFNRNAAIEGLGKAASESAPAVYLSFYDCLAYCTWAGHRLPTEGEWIAASVADARVYSQGAYLREDFPLREDARFLKSLSTEWTSTFDTSGRAVVRSGPRWARTTDWRDRGRRHRAALDPEFYDVMTSFRVVI